MNDRTKQLIERTEEILIADYHSRIFSRQIKALAQAVAEMIERELASKDETHD
jgi:hypothetical protein